MKVAYIGNFEPSHSTETHVGQALMGLGHDLTQVQENSGMEVWSLNPVDYDLILWTRTGWPWDDPDKVHEAQMSFLSRAADVGVPTVGYHLDRWWGLPREREIYTEPFFKVSLLVTADGGHPGNWIEQGIDHVWMPPAVSRFECVPGNYDPRFEGPLAFIGSWDSYHPEWTHRFELVSRLRDLGCRFWPPLGEEAVRGAPLRDLYATTHVNVGDSCLLGDIENYWSDRIPETLGRGGFLMHPAVPGLEKHFVSGAHLVTWNLWDWDHMVQGIQYYLNEPELRKEIAVRGREHVLENHTYTVRMQQVMALL